MGVDIYTEDEGETLDWFMGDSGELIIMLYTMKDDVRQQRLWAQHAPGTWYNVSRTETKPDLSRWRDIDYVIQ